MDKNNKHRKNVDNSTWWMPTPMEKIMLGLTVATVLVSLVSQAGSIVNNLTQFTNIYKQLYPLLNIFHIYVLFYIIFSLRNIKQPVPSPKDKDEKNYLEFRKILKTWIKEHFGKIYWEEECKEGLEEWEGDKNVFNAYIDKQVKDVNKNIEKIHTYFVGVFICYVFLYIFELVNSLTYSVEEPVLHILTIIFNNISTLFWFYIFATLNITTTTIELKKGETTHKTFTYIVNKCFYCFKRFVTFEKTFERPNKFKPYKENKKNNITGEEEPLIISKFWTYKLVGLSVLIISTIGFIVLIVIFKNNSVLEIGRLKNDSDLGGYYNLFWVMSTVSILLGGVAMLATFSRLSSGFKRVPFTAFLIMVFYAAVQPLFFAGSELDASNMKMGQMMFIVNALCLIGKFGLLNLIKWFFANYNIAYYFIAGQIVKGKAREIDDKLRNELFIDSITLK